MDPEEVRRRRREKLLARNKSNEGGFSTNQDQIPEITSNPTPT